MSKIVFVSGIDTDVGKTFATGMLAKYLLEHNFSVITQKLIQTGIESGLSEDIIQHRKIMNIPLQEVDFNHTTCPYVFKFPCSPHLAAAMENQTINLELIDQATAELSKYYDLILLEGAGGLMVPLTPDYLTIDFVADHKLPLILVTSGKLGSINHTLLSLVAAKKYKIEVAGIIYNRFIPTAPEIIEDSKQIIQSYLSKLKLNAPIIELADLRLLSQQKSFDGTALLKSLNLKSDN